jgi:hypothetical protein
MSDDAKKEGQKAKDETKAAELSDEDLGQVAGGTGAGFGVAPEGLSNPAPSPAPALEEVAGNRLLNIQKVSSW